MSFLPSIARLSTPLNWLFGTQANLPRKPPPPMAGPFSPTYRDVCRARALLGSRRLPTELVLQVLDYAQYWPTYEYTAHIHEPIVATARGARLAVATLCCDTSILDNPVIQESRGCGEQCKIKSIQFDIASRDQGWTSQDSHGTFSTSSWTEVSILRGASGDISQQIHLCGMHDPINSPRDFHETMADRGWSLVKRPESALQGPQDGEGDFAWYLQGNRVARPKEEYHIGWTEDGSWGNQGAGTGEGFVRELQDGDRILIWARAKYPGWQCEVESVTITVKYSF